MRDLERRQAAFDRFSKYVDGPLMVLSLLMVPLIVVPLVVDVTAAVEQAFLVVDYVIWAIFTVEYVTKLYLSSKRWEFVKRNIPDLIIVLIPLLRPLRILRSVRLLKVLRLTRVVAFAQEGLGEVRSVLKKRGLNYVLLIGLFVIFVAAFVTLELEKGSAGANIKNFADAIWWAMTTVTTVGYGDHYPTTSAGRGIAVVVMVTGIALFGVITASIAAYFVDREEGDDLRHLARKLDEVMARLDTIERHVSRRSDEAA